MVGDRGSLEVAQTPGGLYKYQSNSFKDDRSERHDLARDIADDLLEKSVEDGSMVAQGVMTRALLGEEEELAETHGLGASKLFLTFVFADLQAEVENQMGIAIGANNSQNFGDQ